MNKNKHLTEQDRRKIEEYLNDGARFKEIARFLKKDPSTISKEIKKHIVVSKPSSFNKSQLKCSHLNTCSLKNQHGYSFCKSSCEDFSPVVCPKLIKPPFVCNPCSSKNGCRFVKHYYRAREAFCEYKSELSFARTGINMSAEAFDELDTLITPLVEKGQSIAHICNTNKDKIAVSRRCLYNYYEKNFFTTTNIDLPRKVRYKPRKQHNFAKPVDKRLKEGRDYQTFLEFCNQENVTCYVEMDTVVGSGKKCLLTLLLTNSKFMIARLIDDLSFNSVLQSFYYIREVLKSEIAFSKLFSLILTDNGSEFADPSLLECDQYGEITSKVFYCTPSKPYEKGKVEKNHEHIRQILPKGSDFDNLTQTDIDLMMSHINSYTRDSLNGKSPYEVFTFLYGERVATVLGITKVSADAITLKPYLLKK